MFVSSVVIYMVYVVVWVRHVPYSFRYSNTWTPVGGTVSEGYGTFMNWRLASKNTSQGESFKGL